MTFEEVAYEIGFKKTKAVKKMTEFERIVKTNICGDGYDAEARAEAIIEAHTKYRWHDLRKNPKDLPPRLEISGTKLYYSEYVLVFDGKDFYIADRAYNPKPIWREKESLIDINVIAWREIEPFEEVE